MIFRMYIWIVSIVIVGIFMLPSVLNGQVYFQGSLQTQNGYIDNFASAGLFGKDIYNISYRNQWTDYKNRPQWLSFNASLPLYRFNGGVGFAFEQLNIGIEKNIFASASYNYIYKLHDGIISAGFSLGLNQTSLEGSLIRTPDGDYQNQEINHKDDWLPISYAQSIRPVMGVAAQYLGPFGLIGLSLKNITPIKFKLTDVGLYSKTTTLIFSYQQKINLEKIIMVPELRIKSDFVQLQADYGINFNWRNNIFLGTSFRGYSMLSLDAWILKGGVSINDKITFYYAYDYPLSKLGQWSGFVHELLMKIQINHPNRRQNAFPKVFNPRLL